MSSAKNRPVESSTAAADATSLSQPWENHTVRFTAQWVSSVAVIGAYGELDASNANQLANYVQRCSAHAKRVIVDLTGLEFFGTAGFSALHTINVRCAGADVEWAVVPGTAVSRLLRICDPDKTLPTTDSAAAGLATDGDEPQPLLQLIPQPR